MNNFRHVLLAVLSCFLFSGSVCCAADYQCAFTKEGWNPADWLIIKEPRNERIGGWVQEKECLRNRVPEGVSKKELINQAYVDMVLKDRKYTDVEIRCTMSFEDRGSPGIVLRCGLGKNKEGVDENRDMIWAGIWDQGICIWQYKYEDYDGKPNSSKGWHQVGFSRLTIPPGKKVELKVTVKRDCIEAEAEGQHVGFYDDRMPLEGFVGISAGEGVNRIYDFSVTSLQKK